VTARIVGQESKTAPKGAVFAECEIGHLARSGGLGDRCFGDFDGDGFFAVALTCGAQIDTKTRPGRDLKREKRNGELKRQLFHVLFPYPAIRAGAQ
jgi:hypothetical protein